MTAKESLVVEPEGRLVGKTVAEMGAGGSRVTQRNVGFR